MSSKKQEIEQNTYLFFNYAFWRRFLSELYYPDEIVTENEGNIEALPISRALPMSSNLITLFARALP